MLKHFLLYLLYVLSLVDLLFLLFWVSNVQVQHSQKTTSPSLPTTSMDNMTSYLLQRMTSCSRSLGVKMERLQNSNIMQISQDAAKLLSVMRKFIPQTFLDGYRNPCWYSNMSLSSKSQIRLIRRLKSQVDNLSITDVRLLSKEMFHYSGRKKLSCLPFFYLAGFPKSGTTTLHETLKKHPLILPPYHGREPHWYTRIPLENLEEDYLNVATKRYLLNFETSQMNHDTIIYDGSNSYLWDSNFRADDQDYCATPAIVSQITPNAKFIVIMRDPVSRLYSRYYYSCTLHFGPHTSKWPKVMQQDPAGHFHTKVVSDIAYFKKCLRKYSLYECTNYMSSKGVGCSTVGRKLVVSIYYIHLLKWMQFFPKENFLLLKMDDVIETPIKTMRNISNFLGLPAARLVESASSLVVAKRQEMLYQNLKHFEMLPETRKLLEEFYEPYQKILERFN